MNTLSLRVYAWLLCGYMFVCSVGCTTMPAHDAPPPTNMARLRIATYNVALFGHSQGELIRRLERDDKQAAAVATVLQRLRPDIVLLNEFDYDPEQHAATLFQTRYLESAQAPGLEPLVYPYRFLAPVNTGVPSGLDLDRDGKSDGPGDAWGYGYFPGQYGMLILSRYPLDTEKARTFQHFLWDRLPNRRPPQDAMTAEPWFSKTVWPQLRLSSKSHWDVPVTTPIGPLHLLACHPAPPAFEGPEKRNTARNRDEILFWKAYLQYTPADTLCDDQGRCGGLPTVERFVLLGDLNNDPADGSGDHSAIIELLEDARVLRYPTPRSVGGNETSQHYLAQGIAKRGAPAHVTSDFGKTIGTLRVDYVLPSTGFQLIDSGVFWPARNTPEAAAIQTASDHRPVWVDIER